MAGNRTQKTRIHWAWKALGVLIVVGIGGAGGTFFYLYATFPKNAVLNDTQDKVAFCEEYGLRGGNVGEAKPGHKMYVFGTSCAVLTEGGSYFGCLILPKAANLTIPVSAVRTEIPSQVCGPGYRPELKQYLPSTP